MDKTRCNTFGVRHSSRGLTQGALADALDPGALICNAVGVNAEWRGMLCMVRVPHSVRRPPPPVPTNEHYLQAAVDAAIDFFGSET